MANTCQFCELPTGTSGLCAFHDRVYVRCKSCNKLMKRANHPLLDGPGALGNRNRICCECLAVSGGRCDTCGDVLAREAPTYILRLPRMGAAAVRVCGACNLKAQPLALFAPDSKRVGSVISVEKALQLQIRKAPPRERALLTVRNTVELTPSQSKYAIKLASKLGPSDPGLFLHFVPQTFKPHINTSLRIPMHFPVLIHANQILLGLSSSHAMQRILGDNDQSMVNLRINPLDVENGIPTFVTNMWADPSKPPTLPDTISNDDITRVVWMVPDDLPVILRMIDGWPKDWFMVPGEEPATKYMDFSKIRALIGGA